jgi:NADPH2:quinone reductase
MYAMKPPLPYTPGTDGAGTIEAVGPDAGPWTPGDRVYTDGIGATTGTDAELVVCSATHVHRLPASVSFTQGAALGVPYSTAWRAMFIRGFARPGETILVHGASGGVGTAAVQLARAHGLTVIGTAGTEEGLALVRSQGAHHTLNHRDPAYADAMNEVTGGRGVDLVLEMLANVNLDRDLDFLAHRGRVVVVGNRGRIEIDPRKTMSKDASILGLTLFNATADDLKTIHAGLFAGLENGTLQPVVGREMPLSDVATAHVAIMHPGAHGKIVLIP